MSGLSIPRHTQLPPEIFQGLSDMGGVEVKVLITALTFPGIPLTLAAFQNATGHSRRAVISALKAALEKEYLERIPIKTPKGQNTYAYRAKYENAIDIARRPDYATKRGAIFVHPLALKLSIVLNTIGLTQQYLTNGAKSRAFFAPLLAAKEGDTVTLTLKHLENGLRAEGVYPSLCSSLRDAAANDTALAERIVWALVLYPLAQELGLADGAGWLVTAITSNWNFQEMAEDYLERLQARAEQHTARESLPADILRGLEKIGYTSGFVEVARACAEDPRRVRGWLLWAEDEMERDPEHAAARFRRALRSGQQPPEAAAAWADFLDGA